MSGDDRGGENPPLDLRELAEVDSPDVVRGALRRFRRRLGLWGGLAAVVVLGLAALIAAPETPTGYTPARVEDAQVHHDVMAEVTQGPVQLIVLRAARLDDTYALHGVLVAEGLEADEGIFVAQRFGVWQPGDEQENPGGSPGAMSPPPAGPPVDLGGLVGATTEPAGTGPVAEVWLEIPLGREQITVTVAAGVALTPSDINTEPAPDDGPSIARPTGDSVLSGIPTRPGSERVLAELELDVQRLDIPRAIWGAQQ